MSKAHVNPDVAVIREFLENVLDRDWFHLLAANPRAEGFSTWKGFVTDSIDDAIEWLLKWSAKGWNCYYSVNFPSRTRAKKARKIDLEWLDFCHVDIDLPKGMRRDGRDAEAHIKAALSAIQDSDLVADSAGQPHIIMSGNGIQALWPLAKPLKATEANIEKVELINRRLAAAFGGDHCHNAERVLRVPGLPNYPDAKKRERGFVPRLATLVQTTRDFFELADFDGLPKPKALTGTARNADRIDYTKDSYSRNYDPLTFEDFFAQQPDIAALLQEKHDDAGGDRSPVCASLITHIINFMMNEFDCSAHDLLDDHDVLKNIMEIFLEGSEQLSIIEDIAERYFQNDNGYGLGNLGRDINHFMNTAADDKRKATRTTQKRARDRQKGGELAQVPLAEISPLEARVQFIEYVRGRMAQDVLPNYREKANAQPITEANLRTVLHEAGIVAQWDIMRDQARYHVLDDCGHVDARERPAQYWERALAEAHADTRALAEESLLCDALTEMGMMSRRDLPDLLRLIAKGKRYHPIEDYCKAVKWDGLDRIAVLAECVHTDHPLAEVYLRQHFRCCIAAVKSLRRYLQTGDGEQIDTAVILDGAQGIGKSSFWNMLTPDGFMSKGTSLRLGSHGENDSKRECLSGLVCCLNEIGTTYQRSIADALKDFRAARSDEFRVAFGRVPISKPRMTVFCGTANSLLLFDHTGSRRDLVLKVDGFDFRGIEELLANGGLQQIFAQAWHEVMIDGANWWLTKDQDRTRADYNEGHRAVSEDEERITDYLNHTGDMHRREWLTLTAICGFLKIRYTPMAALRLREVLEAAGCEYAEQKRVASRKLRRVFHFPILPAEYKLMTER